MKIKGIKIKNKYTFIAIILILILASLFIFKKIYTAQAKLKSIPVTQAKKGEFTIKLNEIGKLKAEKSIAITNKVSGKIIKCVKDGTIVKPGDLLIKFDDTEFQEDLRKKELDFQNALAKVEDAKGEAVISKIENKLKLEQAQAELGFYKTQLVLAKSNLEKQKRLLKENLVTQKDLENSQTQEKEKELAVLKSRLGLEAEKKKVITIEKQKETKIKDTEISANINKEQVEEVKRKIKDTEIRSPAKGMVVLNSIWVGEGTRKVEEGLSPYRSSNLMDIPDLSKMQVSVKFAEMDIHLLKVGQAVNFTLEAYPDKIYHGKIKYISGAAESASSWWENVGNPKKFFEVIIDVKEAEPKILKPGMTANVEVIIKKINQAVYVPISSIFKKEKGNFVYVKAGRKFKKVPVKAGEKNDNFIVIKSGLDGSETIALKDPDKFLDEIPAKEK